MQEKRKVRKAYTTFFCYRERYRLTTWTKWGSQWVAYSRSCYFKDEHCLPGFYYEVWLRWCCECPRTHHHHLGHLLFSSMILLLKTNTPLQQYAGIHQKKTDSTQTKTKLFLIGKLLGKASKLKKNREAPSRGLWDRQSCTQESLPAAVYI